MPTPTTAPARSTTRRYSTDEERWAAVASRDRKADGRFLFSVLTTGVYCRPGCPSRLPRRENVRFHDNATAAEQAGFRPCKRCRPNGASLEQQQEALVVKACRLIDDAEQAPDLATLAAAVGVSRYHFHRLFKAFIGATPAAYARAVRAQRMRDALARSATITAAIHEAGASSNGRFYAQAEKRLGMTPATYRRGAPGLDIRHATGHSSLGAVLVAATDRGICAILLGDDPQSLLHDLRQRFPQARLSAGDRAFGRRVAQVVALVDAPATGLDLPLDIRGTAFQLRVWQALRGIPCGTTTDYGELAQRLGLARSSARAVAQAVAANPLAVAIPCHRVIRRDGDLAGYRWGIERKRALLSREKYPSKRD